MSPAAAEIGRLQQGYPLPAANCFTGLLLWIPVNKAKLTRDSEPLSVGELERYADAAVRVFLATYGEFRQAQPARARLQRNKSEWALRDSNPGPTDYESGALTAELRAH